MPDNVTANGTTVVGGPIFAADDIGGILYPRQKLTVGPDGVNNGDVGVDNPLPVAGALRAAAVVSGSVTVGDSAVQLPSALARRFHIKASFTNSVAVWLGPNTVTVGGGYQLMPGESVLVPLELTNLNVLFAIASVAAQAVTYLGEV